MPPEIDRLEAGRSAGRDAVAEPVRVQSSIAKGGQLSGRVVDPADFPVAGARLILVVGGVPNAHHVAVTDAAGGYVMQQLPDGPLSLRVTAEGYATAQLGDLRLDRAPQRRLQLEPIRLMHAVRYHGRVVCGGLGVHGATVRILPVLVSGGGPTALVREVSTSADGSFEVLEAPPPPVRVAVDSPQHRPPAGGARLVEVAGPPLWIECSEWPRLHGAVVDGITGEPLAQVEVALRGRDSLGSDLTREVSTTASDGSFELTVRDAHSHTLIAARTGYVTDYAELDAAAPARAHRIRLEPAAEIAGQVRRDGDPCQASLALQRTLDQLVVASGSTSSTGSYVLTGIPAGSYDLLVDPNIGARQTRRVDVVQGQRLTLMVDIDVGAACQGRVLGDLDLPAEVVCRMRDGLTRRGVVRADQTFVVEGLGAGQWSLTAYSKRRTWRDKSSRRLLQYLPWRADLVIDQAAAREGLVRNRDVESPSRRLGSLRAQLTPADGGCAVTLEPLLPLGRAIPPGLLRGVISTAGTLQLDAVLPGEWRVVIHSDKGARATIVTVAAGRVCWIDPSSLRPVGR